MKKKLLALVCALVMIFSLASCGLSTPDTVGKVGDFEVSSGLYLLAQFSAYQQAAQLAGTDQDATDVKAFLKETITTDADSGETAVVQDYVADKTLETLRTFAAIDARFAELGGELTAEQTQVADNYAQQLMDQYGSTYTANGIGLETLKAFERIQLKHTLLLTLVYGALFGGMSYLLHIRPQPAGHLEISGSAALTAVMLALTAFAVSNLGFLPGSEINMSIFSIRTLVDFSGVLILSVQHEQLQENALHSELAAMDEVLHRQYEQYKRSKEGINLINRRYHELKIQLARIREEQDQTKQNAAIAAMEQNIRQYEAENKTGNPVLDTLLTAKTMECQQENITITSVADGRMLGFLTIRELCTIVGVALDNAIAAVRAEPDPEKRLIKVAVYSQGGFAMLRFEHYTETAPALDADGLPQQGSDLKSVRTTVGQHGGSMTLHWENNWCTLRILFPLPKNK